MDWTLFPVFALAVMAAWLGLSLVVRNPRDAVTRLFGWLSLHLTIYGLATAFAPLTASAGMARGFLAFQALESVLLPPVFLHFILATLAPQRRSQWQRIVLWAFYVLGVLMALYALLGSAMVQERDILRFPAGVLTWVWVAQRAIPLLLAVALLIAGFRHLAGDDLARRRWLFLALSACMGVLGALIATVSSELRVTPAFGHALMALALVVLAYAVLVYRSLLPQRLARRAVYRSMIGGALTALYVAMIAVIAPRLGMLMQVDGPLVGAFMLAVVLAVAGPLRDWVSGELDRLFFHREFDYSQVLRSFSDDVLERGTLPDQLQVALETMCGTFGIRGGCVALREGPALRIAAATGDAAQQPTRVEYSGLPDHEQIVFDEWPVWPAARLLVPLRLGEDVVGALALAAKRSGAPYSESERALLASLAGYLALAVRHHRRQQEEQLALAALAEQARQLQAEHEHLLAQATHTSRTHPAGGLAGAGKGLRVYALGPLRVERDGQAIERWGGDKAGTYQAEALFALLFERRGRGVTKDEAAEVIWPDLQIDRADMAFHRTVSALRRTLEPGLRRGNQSATISFHHERYWLNPECVGWDDVDAFTGALEHGHTLLRNGDYEAARAHFVQASEWYRGDYLDDCPFVGDSHYVEQRRGQLREQSIEGLLALGSLYERASQTGEAVTCYRRALALADGDCPRADEALARMHHGL